MIYETTKSFSEKPANGPYPDESSRHPASLFFNLCSNFILTSLLTFTSGLFHSVCPARSLHALISALIRATCLTHVISSR